jgi:hypothetical protein
MFEADTHVRLLQQAPKADENDEGGICSDNSGRIICSRDAICLQGGDERFI